MEKLLIYFLVPRKKTNNAKAPRPQCSTARQHIHLHVNDKQCVAPPCSDTLVHVFRLPGDTRCILQSETAWPSTSRHASLWPPENRHDYLKGPERVSINYPDKAKPVSSTVTGEEESGITMNTASWIRERCSGDSYNCLDWR